ncbi:MAG: hypothetical protein ABI835_10825 [Chloroflexota bacterium]
MQRTFVVLLISLLCCAACTSQPETTVNGAAIPVRVLESWQPQEDTLTAQDAARAWRFNGQAGDAIALSLGAKDGGNVSLTLQDAAGNMLAEGNNLRFTLPAGGIYTALVRLGAGESSAYSLTLGYTDRAAPTPTPSATFTLTPTLTPSPTFTQSPTFTSSPTFTPTPTYTPVYTALGTLTGQLEVGVSVEGAFLSQFERHIYLFTGAEGQQVTLTMAATSSGSASTVDPVLTLYDPAGQPLATDDNSGGDHSALLRDVRLPASGEYVVQALGGGTGGYRISLQTNAPTPSGEQPTATPTAPLGTITPVAAGEQLTDHVLALGVIDRPGAFDRYFVDAQVGDFLSLSVRPMDGSPLRPRVEIYTPGGELLFITTLSNGQSLIPSLPIGETGRYGVFVNDDSRTGGAYTIAYGLGTTLIDDLRGSLPPETPETGGGVLTVRDLWTLPLVAGDVIALEAGGAALNVVAPDGAAIASALGAVQFTAAESGDYRVYASGGAYSLVWRYLVAAPTPGAPVLILSADDALAGQAYLTYPFQGRAGRRVHIRVEALDAGLDPVAQLLDPTGVTVASGDDSAGSLNPDFSALLPTDGTYRLRINDYSGTGGIVNVTIEMLS